LKDSHKEPRKKRGELSQISFVCIPIPGLAKLELTGGISPGWAALAKAGQALEDFQAVLTALSSTQQMGRNYGNVHAANPQALENRLKAVKNC